MKKSTPGKFAKDLSFMEDDDWKSLKAHDREQQKQREENKRRLRETKENAHAGLDFDSDVSLRHR